MMGHHTKGAHGKIMGRERGSKAAIRRAQRPNERNTRSSRKGETQRHDAEASGGTWRRHSKAMRAPRRHVRREVGVGIRLSANFDVIMGEVACTKLPCSNIAES